jgi:hypothetical protein
MADNVGYTPGSGETIATDEIGGVQYQRVKPVWGVDGVANDVNATTPLPVEVIGELTQAIEAMRMAIISLTKSVGLAQVNPLTGRLLVDQSALTQQVSGAVSANQNGTWNITNLTQVGSANAAIVPLSLERGAADNLRRNINVT